MKLISYMRDNHVRHGAIEGDEVCELGDGDLLTLLAGIAALDHGLLDKATARLPLTQVRLAAPLTRPGKLLAVAANYQDHITETGGEPLDKSRLSPRLFLKPSSSIAGPDAVVALPGVTREMDWEAELAVVIGRKSRNVPQQGALDVVAGYMTSNDVSARSLDLGYERDTDDKAVWFFDWLVGKWFDGFAPLGPYLVTADEVPDPQALPVELEVNGQTRQHGSTKDMIFSVAELIAFASRLMTLEPGDVILTGTPSGVGAATGDYLRPGDEMTTTIGHLGSLRTVVGDGTISA